MIVGIDLGTTNSLIAHWQGDRAQIIPNSLGERLTPSVVSIAEGGTVLVGAPARDRLLTHPEATAAVFKRHMGTERRHHLGDRKLRPEELSALVIKALVADAEHHLNEKIDEAVISVPAYFNDTQRRATKLAGELAGVRVERLINEPTAAALAYGLHNREADSTFLVLDLGGGTYDVTLLEIFEGVIEIHASAGDNYLGGEDFSQALLVHLLAHARKEIDIPDKALRGKLLQQLRYAAEWAKIALQRQSEANIRLRLKGREIVRTVTEADFDRLAAPLLQRLAAPIEKALRDGRLRPEEIDDILLVGGSSRLKCVRRMVAKTFGRLCLPNLNPDETIALGAAIQAGLKARAASLKDMVMTDVTPYTLGIQTCEQFGAGIVADNLYAPLIERNTTVPVSRSEHFSTLADNQKKIRVKVYQGESPNVADNIPLGELVVPVPPRPAGEVSIEVRFTYDINGILEVEVKVPITGDTHRLVIEKTPGAMTPEEVEASLAALAHLKVHPREAMVNTALLSRAARVYEMALGEERKRLGHLIAEFRAILETQDAERIGLARERFGEIIDTAEERYAVF